PESEQETLKEHIASVLKMRLKDQAVSVRRNCAQMIQYAPESERTELIEMGLKDQDIVVRSTSVQIIEYAPESERTRLIEMGLKDQNISVRRNCA
ncbi:TPA: hypothetical protein DEP26_01065, partial [Candidatus Uhrbacteria bacterium]|nr:hypothetical protein [Candidatus Uhrbacteria bacterium]